MLVEIFNNHYINIVEKSLGSVQKPIGSPSNPGQDSNTVADIIEYYKNHPSIMQIKETFKRSNSSDFPEATIKGINSIIQSLDPKKSHRSSLCPYKTNPNCFKDH